MAGDGYPVEAPGHRQSRWWFFGSVVATSVLGLLSTRIGSRSLDDASSSDLRAVAGALSAISILALGVQLVLVGVLAQPSGASRMVRPPTGGLTLGASAVAAGAAGLTAFAVIDSTVQFRIEAAFMVAVAVGAICLSIPARAVLLGGGRWRDLGAIAAGASALRLAVVLAAWGNAGLRLQVVAIVLAEVFGAGAALTVSARVPRASRWPRGGLRNLAIGTIALIGLMLVVLLATVASRARLDDADAYTQSASVARIVFVVAFAGAFVFFPELARFPLGSSELQRAFHSMFLVTACVAISAATAVIAAPDLVAELVTGRQSTSPTVVRILAVAFALFGLAAVSLMQYVVHGSRMVFLSWPVAAGMALVHLVVTTPESLAWASLIASLGLLVVVSVPAVLRVQPLLVPTVIERSSAADDAARTSVTIVIPCFNPGAAVVDTVNDLVVAFDSADLDLHIIAVSDGSSDESDALLDQLQSPVLRHIRHPVNRGKGAALRTGFMTSRSALTGFVDADGDLPPSQLVDMVRIQAQQQADIVFGSKRHTESRVDVSAKRRLTSRLFQVLIKVLFRLDIDDTQTGIKLYTREVLDAVLPQVREDGFALDLELFVAARSSGFERFVETPVTLRRFAGSTISSRSAFNMLWHTLGIFWRAKITLHYLRAGSRTAIDDSFREVR